MKYLSSIIIFFCFLFILFLSCKESAGPDPVTEWIVYDTTNSDLPSNMITGLACNHGGNIWAGSGWELAVYRQGGIIV